MKQRDLIKKLKRQHPKISKEQINSTIRHVRAIMSEWKLRVQYDIYEYLLNAEDEWEDAEDDGEE